VPHHVRKVAWSVNYRPLKERQGELAAIDPKRLVQGRIDVIGDLKPLRYSTWAL
jgi:hypothetical protein